MNLEQFEAIVLRNAPDQITGALVGDVTGPDRHGRATSYWRQRTRRFTVGDRLRYRYDRERDRWLLIGCDLELERRRELDDRDAWVGIKPVALGG